MEGSARLRRMLPGLALALTLALGAVLLASVDVVASSPYSSAAETNLRALDLDLMSAAAAGYTESDLAPVLDGEQLLLRQPPPAGRTPTWAPPPTSSSSSAPSTPPKWPPCSRRRMP